MYSEIKRCYFEHRFIAGQKSDYFVYLLFLEEPPLYLAIVLGQSFLNFSYFFTILLSETSGISERTDDANRAFVKTGKRSTLVDKNVHVATLRKA